MKNLEEAKKQLEKFKNKLEEYQEIFPVAEKEKELEEKEKLTTNPNFWKDSQKAAKIMQEIERNKEDIADFKKLEQKVGELAEFSELVEEEDEETFLKDFEKLEKKMKSLELKLVLDGKYDRNSAILSIHSGAGGMDAQDWAKMLLRMYLRFSEKNNFQTKIIHESYGQEGGIKSVTLEVLGAWAYGYLKGEAGVHRLVRLSPFNADNLRQTSFALVEILPVVSSSEEIKIEPKDIKIDTFRSQGAGGQSVNTTDSAVRITHISTGIQATCQNERSQAQNKDKALEILKAKLIKKQMEEKEQEKANLKVSSESAEWGSQIRSYVLHPYKLVKDHRTKTEIKDTESVLDGDIKPFIEAYLSNFKK